MRFASLFCVLIFVGCSKDMEQRVVPYSDHDFELYFAARSEDRFEFGRDPHPLFDFKRASNGRLKEILLQNCRTHTQSPAADYIDKLKSVIDEGVSLVYECNHLRMNEVEYADCMTHVYYVVFPSETTNIVCRRYCGQDTLRLFTNCVDCLEIPADSICARDSFMSADEFTIDDEMMQWLPYWNMMWRLERIEYEMRVAFPWWYYMDKCKVDDTED